jgi:4-hydroxybenzoate polyprenyltransferase
MRISNLPTVWSNVVHGMSVGLLVAIVLPIEREYGQSPPIGFADLGRLLDQGFLLLVGMSLLYSGGMVLNDICDVAIDRNERPGRPIPSGRVARPTAATVAVGLLLAGWACSLVYMPSVAVWTAVLVAAIVAYNLLHRLRWLGLLLMAGCRGLVVWIAALTMSTTGAGIEDGLPRILGGVLAIGCYTLLVTLIAWGEALPRFPNLARWVGVMIALMPVVDAVFVWQYGMGPMAVFCLGCAGLSLGLQRWVSGS